MPRLNVSATFEPVVVPGSTDYESYQTDLDAGRIGSFDELEARLATRAGSLVRINGTLVRETRQVTVNNIYYGQ